MTCEVWDAKKNKMVSVSDADKLIAFKRDDYGGKVLVEPARLNNVTGKHFVFRTESGMDILISKDSAGDGVDCFYSNKNTWSISLKRFEDFEELI